MEPGKQLETPDDPISASDGEVRAKGKLLSPPADPPKAASPLVIGRRGALSVAASILSVAGDLTS